MASVIKRGGKWYVKFRAADGTVKRKVLPDLTEKKAKQSAADLERAADRQILGLDPTPPRDGGGTVAALFAWWLDTYSAGSPSHDRNISAVRGHFSSSALGAMRLVDVRAGDVETFLQAKAATLAPQSLNHLRRYLVTAFSRAIEAGRWEGANEAKKTRKRKVPKAAGDYLRVEEVAPMLMALEPRRRPLFATAIYTGLRKGELLALRKSDVELRPRLLTVARTNTRATTKGGQATAIPIAADLIPYLEAAVASSPSELLFPGANGLPMRKDADFCKALRRALADAGITTGYAHVCRRLEKGRQCRHVELAPDAALRLCPVHGAKLWPKAKVRQIRFHSLRHTTGSLMVMAGVNVIAVSKMLRHSDVKITADVYAHLSPEYLRAEVDKMKLGTGVPELLEPLRAAVNAGAGAKEGPNRVQALDAEKAKGRNPVGNPAELRPLNPCAIVDSNHWPSASETDALSS